MAHFPNFGFAVRIVFAIVHNEMGRERHGNYFMGFSEKKSYSGQFGHFGPIMVRSYNFGSALRFF